MRFYESVEFKFLDLVSFFNFYCVALKYLIKEEVFKWQKLIDTLFDKLCSDWILLRLNLLFDSNIDLDFPEIFN